MFKTREFKMTKEGIFRIALVAGIIFFSYQYGFGPLKLGKNTDVESGREYWSEQLAQSREAEYDVVVYGAEPQGVSAALSAARLGARTLLISNDEDAGGIVTKCLIPELELPYGHDGKILNGGLLEEFNKELGERFSDKKYLEVINKLLSAEETLEVQYNAAISGVSMSGVYLDAVELKLEDETRLVSGKMFIDASDGAELLEACQVPYYTGSGDLNMENSFMPVSLNFELSAKVGADVDFKEINSLLSSRTFYEELEKYPALNSNVGVDRFSIFPTDGNKFIISGLQFSGVNVLDDEALDDTYEKAVEEAKNLAEFLSKEFKQFSGLSFSRAAQSLRVSESRHYYGKYMLKVQDIMDNRFFEDTVSMGSYPVRIDKFAAKGSFIAGRGVQYGIPLRCLVPEKTSNMLMAGPRISYSSLAASSAGTVGTSIGTGEAAGALAVFCAARSENPGFVNTEHEKYAEFEEMLKEKGMYLPKKEIETGYKDNWSYPAAGKLVTLGLVAGGIDNNLKYDQKATQKDLAFILINGIYRVDKTVYSKELYDRLRPFITNDSLTFDRAVSLLGALYDFEGTTQEVYEKLCRQHRINDIMQQRLEDREVLTMDEVYYLGAYSIEYYTGKDISKVTSEWYN